MVCRLVQSRSNQRVKMAEPLIRQEISKVPFLWKKFIFVEKIQPNIESSKKSSIKPRRVGKKFKQT